MKRLALLMILLVCVTTACNPFSVSPPKSVDFDGKTYKAGFYGDLFTKDISYVDDSFTVSGQLYQRVNVERHDWIANDLGSKGVTLYCAEAQWNDTQQFYSDPDNFTYYCLRGNVNTSDLLEEIDDIDREKFEELSSFTANSSYNPFSFSADKGQKSYSMPDWPDGEIRFYKESKDGLFTSSRGKAFYVLDNKLVLLYRYDFADGDEEKECMYGVEVPDDLGSYFIEYIENHLS